MNNIKNYENLNQKKVLLRLDLNVPLKNGAVTDQTRIDKVLPIIEHLLKKNFKSILLTQYRRPKEKVKKNHAMKPISEN